MSSAKNRPFCSGRWVKLMAPDHFCKLPRALQDFCVLYHNLAFKFACSQTACTKHTSGMGLLPDTYNCGLRMRRECRFPRHRLQRKPPVSDPGMHHGACVTHVPWCMSGSLTRGWRGKRSRHSRRMRNPHFYVSGKRPMTTIINRESVHTGWISCAPNYAFLKSW